ncbi:Uncharacterised protein (plasmid) [Tsukamurella tyrosinosolvens]|uniref:Uncharacterized protein n=1 Tax=Tsukamurella tyrosinosolvens TaxID=57704 RepID=A0A1H4V5R9_TSUTY|nr:hypothetical protein [Tsukamurella tyrosinosolvens]KXO91049.1 hypothetical protein AXK58_21705 [Tsukamurella tyrosinosolvens]SEC75978.1 hypothetical protein SAMN04489793_3141 [Tsukamurella tyrosinosolvens]VEH90684.1 Uncharacterised protein [Tsukamurella tyrosinosolvens]
MAEISFEGAPGDSIAGALRFAAGFAARQLLNEEVPVDAVVTWSQGGQFRGRLTDQLDTTITVGDREIELNSLQAIEFYPPEEASHG